MIAAFLADGLTELKNVHHCNDTIACLRAVHLLNESLEMVEAPQFKLLNIRGCRGRIIPSAGTVSCGESGFALRVMAAVAALSESEIILTGTGSLLQRPVSFFENVLTELKVVCKSTNGLLPLVIRGPMNFKNISVDGSLSSQFLSGLLMVYPLAGEDHTIEVSNLKSKQYIDLTIQVMKDFGVTVTHESYKQFFIPGKQKYTACSVEVEGDWSAASFMLVAGATAGEVTLNNLSMDSLQPDKLVMKVLMKAGADINVNNKSVSVKKKNLESFSFDATDCPDLFPPLVALAVQCSGISEIIGVERLIHKESNRALALQLEFSKLNDKLIDIEGNKMIIHGGLPLQSAYVFSHNDHRIAMALAIAGLNVEGGITISGIESVEKSYPDFFVHLDKLMRKK